MLSNNDTATGNRRRTLGALAGILLFTITFLAFGLAWVYGVEDYGKPIEELARKEVCIFGREPLMYDVHGVHDWGDGGKMVVFTAQCVPGTDNMVEPTEGFVIYERGVIAWEFVEKGYAIEPSQRERYDDLLDFAKSSHTQGDWAWVQGRVHSPDKVAAVEVVFDNGQVERHQVQEGRFALVSRETMGACELRALDSNGRVVDFYRIWGGRGGDEGIPPLDPELTGDGWEGIIGNTSLATREACLKVLPPPPAG